MPSSSCTITASTNARPCNFCSEFRKIRCLWRVAPYKTKAHVLETSLQFRGMQLGHGQVQVSSFARKPSGYEKSLVVSCGLSSGENDTEGVTSEEKESNRGQIAPSTTDVHSLLVAVCDTTSIAEFKLNLSGFQLFVKRNTDGKKINPPAPIPPAIQMNSSSQVSDLNGSAATTSVAISKPKPALGGIQSSDEGLMILQSPKVGIFRRSRTIKGKRAPPSCKEKQEVKEGQVLCFIEQLGGEIPIESDVSGEVIKILRKDGEPVGYGDALIAILPSFPGIKKLQ